MWLRYCCYKIETFKHSMLKSPVFFQKLEQVSIRSKWKDSLGQVSQSLKCSVVINYLSLIRSCLVKSASEIHLSSFKLRFRNFEKPNLVCNCILQLMTISATYHAMNFDSFELFSQHSHDMIDKHGWPISNLSLNIYLINNSLQMTEELCLNIW